MKKTIKYIGIFLLVLVTSVMLKSNKAQAKNAGNATDKVIAGVYESVIEGKRIIAVSPNVSFRYNSQDNTSESLYVSDLADLLSVNEIANITAIVDKEGAEKNLENKLATGDVLTDSSGKDYTLVLYGDSDSDSLICRAGDINVIVDSYVWHQQFDEETIMAANLYVDNTLNVFDIARMKNKYTGQDNLLGDTLVSEMPEEEGQGQTQEYKLESRLESSIVQVGSTCEIEVSLTPETANQTLVFSSSNPSVATVDNQGVITGVSNGQAVITVKSEIYNLENQLNITVIPATANITRLTVERDPYPTTGLPVGESVQVTATIEPENATNKNVIWTSSNPSVASVNENGLVTGISDGETIITATCEENENIKASLTITVNSNIYISRLSLSSVIGIKVGTSSQITATIQPENATNKTLEWTSSNEEIATVDQEGNVTGISVGNVTITAKTTDGTNIEVEKPIVIYAEQEGQGEEGGPSVIVGN